MKEHDMNQGDYTIYQIKIDGCTSLVSQNAAIKALEKHSVPGGYQHITPVMKTAPGSISVPRLFTTWRGDANEAHWQDELRAALLKADDKADITITAEPWAILPGYPIDTMETTE